MDAVDLKPSFAQAILTSELGLLGQISDRPTTTLLSATTDLWASAHTVVAQVKRTTCMSKMRQSKPERNFFETRPIESQTNRTLSCY